ncbi:sigma factor-like helix-turn-helix DNA-binding protein [Streptomyces sp. NPDC001848]|uniref:sigma factor-like helix-turn-helix DNA-binding protein n=1 Tax=Streptomyces sp. NPDC001848 TaxID=3364618 RepID=UPI003693EBBE
MAVYGHPTSGHRRPRRPRQARPAEAGGEALERAAEQTPGEDEIKQALQSWAVADAVRTLSPDHSAVLLETHYRGRTMVEAARALSIPSGTVKSRTYHALNVLRPALQERGSSHDRGVRLSDPWAVRRRRPGRPRRLPGARSPEAVPPPASPPR